MKNVLEKLDSLGKSEQNQLIIGIVALMVILVVLAILKRKSFIGIMQFILYPFEGSKKLYHPSFKDRYDGDIK
jgi:hypothetical protein